jgi:uridine phosphorylase
MPFPKFKNKHLEEALFTAHDYCSYKKWSKNAFPRKMIFCYQRSTLAYFKRKYRGKFEKIKLYNNQEILRIGGIGFMRMNGIGAPHAVTFMEEMIACGTREFINMGTAGGLSETGVFVCNKAVRDEGTSHHYLPDSVYVSSDESLTKRLARSLDHVGIEYQISPTWTIDAPYRETKREIAHYRKSGIKTVEMEAAALFSVAKVRGAKIAAVFAVSDLLEKEWDPQFHKINLKRTLNKLVDACVDCFGGK